MARTRDTVAPTVIERFVKSLVVTAKSVVLYPPHSNVPLETAEKAAALLGEALQERSEVRLTIAPDGIWHRNARLFSDNEAYSAFAADLYERQLADVRFHAGMSPADLVAFLSLLNYSPQAAQAAGGFERRLWERGVTSITVTHRPPDAPTSPPAGSDEPVASVPARILSAEEVEELVERLAEESDPEVRRIIVADVSEVAGHYVPELSTHLSDPRWYVVRNVVSILGAARSTDVLPLMERALRHQEPRVRREAVRTVAGIGGVPAARVLARALQDEDAQTVQLAARSLGETGAVEAVDALAQVAQGDGEGNRDTGPRVEAIEALGRIGSPKALPALKSVASRRSLWGGARMRGLRTAAESAIVQITGRDTPT